MDREIIKEKLENLKVNYLKCEKLYKDYAKCVEQYEIFLARIYENVCRLMVNKKYTESEGEAYFKENEEFVFAINVLDYSLDFMELVDNLIRQNNIGEIELVPSNEDNKSIILKVKYNSARKIKDVEQLIYSQVPQNTEKQTVEISR